MSNEIHQRVPREHSNLKRLILIVSIIVVALLGIYAYNEIDEQNQNHFQTEINKRREEEKERIRNNVTSYVFAERSNYQVSTFGGIHDLHIAVTNNTDYLLENVKVKVI